MEHAFPTFETKNFSFGPVTYGDVAHIYELFSDSDSMNFDGGQTMNSVDEAHQFVHYFSAYHPEFPVLRWAIRSKDRHIFYGTGGFYNMNLRHRRAEIGGEFLKQHWGKGVATGAMSGMIAYGFNMLKLNRLTAMVAPANKAANALAHRALFKPEGCLRQWEKWGNGWVDLNVYSLLQEEWIESIKN